MLESFYIQLCYKKLKGCSYTLEDNGKKLDAILESMNNIVKKWILYLIKKVKMNESSY